MINENDNLFTEDSGGLLRERPVIGLDRCGRAIRSARRMFGEEQPCPASPQTQREILRRAAAYACFASLQEVYLDRARASGMTAYSLALADWLSPPRVLEIDVDAWTGEPGQLIRVKARDNVLVASVTVAIRDPRGRILEAGQAVQSPDGGPWWHYTTRSRIALEPFPVVEAAARDLPGHSDMFTII